MSRKLVPGGILFGVVFRAGGEMCCRVWTTSLKVSSSSTLT